MNFCVPEIEMEEEEDTIPTSSGLSRQKKSTVARDELVELLWQNGQVVMHSQNQRFMKKSPPKLPVEDAVIPAGTSRGEQIRSSAAAAAEYEAAKHLFMQEDEMASWLHYSLEDSFERDFCADLLYPSPSSSNYAPYGRSSQIPDDRRPEDKIPADPRPPIPPTRQAEFDSSGKIHNFIHFSRPKARFQSRPSGSDKAAGTSTVVDSSDTPVIRPGSRFSNRSRSTAPMSSGSMSCDAAAATDGVREPVPCEPTMTSSSGNSGASADPLPTPPADDRKRKAREPDGNECHSEDVDCESIDGKKQARGSTSVRKSRAAEVHNLSERRRRDRINEKMKALQELIPRCNKSDKASMLDEAIEYLKSLQLQVQMMSMGCSMVPMMFPGVQQYMSPMGMGMGMDMGLTRPMLPFPSVLASPPMQPAPTTAGHLGPRLPMPAFHLPPVSTVDLSRIQTNNLSDSASNSNGSQNPNQLRVPNFADPYQQYLGLQQMQVAPPQNQAMTQPGTIKGADMLGNNHPG